jgi:polar amino acid transport system permease protein
MTAVDPWALMPAVLSNVTGTVALALIVIGASSAAALALVPFAMSSRWYVRFPVRVYTYIGRALPPLTWIFAAFFGLALAGIRVVPFMTAFIAFMVFSTAYNIEILRGALESVPRGQYEAARSLGIGKARMMMRIVFPQGLRIAIPMYMTRMAGIFKETSLASVIGVAELTAAAGRATSFQPSSALLVFGVVGVVYCALVSVVIGAQHLLERRFPPTFAK